MTLEMGIVFNSTNDFCKICIIKRSFFIEKKRFYWTNNFTDWSFSKKTNEIFFLTIIKITKCVVHKRWMNKMKKSQTYMRAHLQLDVYQGFYLFFFHIDPDCNDKLYWFLKLSRLQLLYNLILQIWLMIDNHTSNRSPPISKMWSAFFKHLQLLEINVKVVWLTVNQFRVFLVMTVERIKEILSGIRAFLGVLSIPPSAKVRPTPRTLMHFFKV